MHQLLLVKCLDMVILLKEYPRKVKPLLLNTTFLMNFGIWDQGKYLKAFKSKLISRKTAQIKRKRRRSKSKTKMKKRKKKLNLLSKSGI
jgi:hypothetical protein